MSRYGVYPHAIWRATGPHGDGHAEITGQGFVDREVSPAVPYGRMTPLRVFARRSDADKLASRLTFDFGLTGREDRETVLAALKRKVARDTPEEGVIMRKRSSRDPDSKHSKRYHFTLWWGRSPGYGYESGWAFGRTPELAVKYALADASKYSAHKWKLPANVYLQPDSGPKLAFYVSADGTITEGQGARDAARRKRAARDTSPDMVAKVELYNLFRPGRRSPANGYYVALYADGGRRRIRTLRNFRASEQAARRFAASYNRRARVRARRAGR